MKAVTKLSDLSTKERISLAAHVVLENIAHSGSVIGFDPIYVEDILNKAIEMNRAVLKRSSLDVSRT